MIGELPVSLEVNGVTRSIRSDFRDILTVLTSFSDPELEDSEKVYVCLKIVFEEFDAIPSADYQLAFDAALSFIEGGVKSGEKANHPAVMDWVQDEPILFPAINKVAGFETRSVKYIHWWTFLGYYMEISDGIFAQVASIRAKKAKGKKLEKWEREFWSANKSLCVIKPKLTEEEKEEKEALNKLLG